MSAVVSSIRTKVTQYCEDGLATHKALFLNGSLNQTIFPKSASKALPFHDEGGIEGRGLK